MENLREIETNQLLYIANHLIGFHTKTLTETHFSSRLFYYYQNH